MRVGGRQSVDSAGQSRRRRRRRAAVAAVNNTPPRPARPPQPPPPPPPPQHQEDDTWTSSAFTDSTLGCNSVSWAPFQAPRDGAAAPVLRLSTGSCDNRVRVWRCAGSLAEWTEERLPEAVHTDWVRDVAWAPSTGLPSSVVASASEDRTVWIWAETADGGWTPTLLHTFEAQVWRVSWSVTGNVLAVSSGDSKVTLWKQQLAGKWGQISALSDVGPAAVAAS